MNQDEIIEMLRASCDKDKVDPEQNGFWVIHTPELEAFAKLVAQHERNNTLEEVAKEFDAMRIAFGDTADSFATYVRDMKLEK